MDDISQFLNNEAVESNEDMESEDLDIHNLPNIPPAYPNHTKYVNKIQTFIIKYRKKSDFVEEHDASSLGISLFTTSYARVKLYEAMKLVYDSPGKIFYKFSLKIFFRVYITLLGYGFDFLCYLRRL